MIKLKQCLIVDDDPASRYLAKEAIDEIQLAEQVIVRENGAKALDYIKEHCLPNQAHCPELILLDIKMPVMDGYEFLEELSKMEDLQHNNTSIILFSSASHEKEKQNIKAHFPIIGFLEKPATGEKIIELLKKNPYAR
jgi:CheY-like chemotaxis protein